MEDIMISIGRNIKVLRELKNLTQEYMAKQLDMSVSNYSYIENGKTNITFSKLEKIANVLEVDYQQILNLNPTQIFNNNGTYNGTYNGDTTQHIYANEELVKQLQIKDEQIARLTTMLEKAMKLS